MPYLITTHTLDRSSLEAPSIVTRRAVTTLDEANAAIRLICDPTGGRAVWTDPMIYWQSIADGGTVGPLPDGTVITVEKVTWPLLRARAGMAPRGQMGSDFPTAVIGNRIIAAYNAAQDAQ